MRERGRPREFDRDEALDRAMTLFWSRGYEGTSVSDLAKAIGVNKPSLYAAFGCKEELFRQAIELYDALEGKPIQHLLDTAPTARDAVEAALRHNARAYVRGDRPRGCMIVLSSILGTPQNEDVRDFLAAKRSEGEGSLRRRIERGIDEGDVPSGTDAGQLAAFYTTVTQGLSIQARDGAGLCALDSIVDSAMMAWDRLVAEPSPVSDGAA